LSDCLWSKKKADRDATKNKGRENKKRSEKKENEGREKR
jgi:hypothetical protein